jgi:hypothetical protein
MTVNRKGPARDMWDEEKRGISNSVEGWWTFKEVYPLSPA